jgi:hypothetical protein
MGYHIILHVKCKLLPDYIPFIREKYLRKEDSSTAPNAYRHLLQIWNQLDIGQSFYEYDLTTDGVFTCHIEKKPYNHRGDLWEDYEEFLKHIIVPISSEIISCRIHEDDMAEREEIYTDSQLRNIQFRLGEWVDCIEHIYEDDMIVETRVIYKRPFKRSLERDVSRMFE